MESKIKVLFIKIPKTGSTSVRTALNLPAGHHTLGLYKELNAKYDYSFTFVRNTYTRLVSWYRFHHDYEIDGFRKWVNDRRNDKVQDKIFREARQKSINYAKEEGGWNTDREFAIAAGIGNSYGDSGFRKYARQYNWDADKLLEAYKYKFGQNEFSNHKNKRVIQINKWFPKSKERKINL